MSRIRFLWERSSAVGMLWGMSVVASSCGGPVGDSEARGEMVRAAGGQMDFAPGPTTARYGLDIDGIRLGSVPFESLVLDRIGWTPRGKGAIAVVEHGREGGASLYRVEGALEELLLRTGEGQSLSLPRLAPDGQTFAYVLQEPPRWQGEVGRSALQYHGSIWIYDSFAQRGNALIDDAAQVLGWLDANTIVFTRYLPGDMPQQRPYRLTLSSGAVERIAVETENAYNFTLFDRHLLYADSDEPVMTLPSPTARVSVISLDLQSGNRSVVAVEHGALPSSFAWQGDEIRYLAEGKGIERLINLRTSEVTSHDALPSFAPPFDDPMPLAGLKMPYVHQVYDTPNDFNGHWACGPTSTLMAIQHFNRLKAWPVSVNIPSVHESPYGAYIAYKYTAFGTTFNRMQTDAGGKAAYGAYGWCTEGGGAWAWRMQDYAERHDLKTAFADVATFAKLKAATDAGRPVALSTNLTSAGHIITVKGTTSDGKLIVNDPYGNRNKGYMNYKGEDVIYTFGEVIAKWFVTIWSTTPVCTPQEEVCNGKDDDCDGQVDEDEVCERQVLGRGLSWVAPARTSDVDGDGKADICGRGGVGVWCHLSTGTSWSEKGTVTPLSDAAGWDDPTNWATIRMGDVDGDGRADLCARSDTEVTCWKSDGTGFLTAMQGPAWSDKNGWNHFQYHSTMRLLDMDGDGKDDLCARAAKGMICYKSTGDGFEERLDGPPWSDEAGFASAKYYGTLRTGDVDGDGKHDLCIRAAAGMECWLSDGNGFPTKVTGPAWSDATGWGNIQYWSSIRLADVNGDGKADLCARGKNDLQCHFSEGTSFGDAVQVAALADDNGWNDPTNYLTLRTGDVTGDGAQDLCLRANAKMLCYAWDGEKFASIEGPAWSDEDGWNKAQYFNTIQLADMNGDGKADLCGRHELGWRCHPSTGDGFGDAVMLDEFKDAGGWSKERYYATLLTGGPICIPSQEVCNGKDDDCDGLVDEDGVCEQGSGGTGGSVGTGGSGQDGGTQEQGGAGSGQDPHPAGSGGGKATESYAPSNNETSGCACSAVGGRSGGKWAVLGLLVGWAVRRRLTFGKIRIR